MSTLVEKQQDVLATLASRAPTIARNCIRKYNVSLTLQKQTAAFLNVRKNELVETLNYLGIDDVSQYAKDALVEKLILRIQGLFPDTCGICKMEYSVGLDDKPILSCRMCEQGCHDECIKRLTGGVTDPAGIINPFNIPGGIYLCPPCIDRVRPQYSKKHESTSKRDSIAKPSLNGEDDDNDSQAEDKDDDDDDDEDSHDHDEQNHQTDADSSEPTNEIGKQTPVKKTDNTKPDPKSVENTTKGPGICPHYKKGKCKHGASGKQCPKNHPKACPKLMRHGPKTADRPKGCPGAPTCNKWHPELCKTSLKGKPCKYEKCRFRHLTGTKNKDKEIKGGNKRKQGNPGEGNKPSDRNKPATVKPITQKEPFLEMLQDWKKELMESVDQKLMAMMQTLSPSYSPSPNPFGMTMPQLAMMRQMMTPLNRENEPPGMGYQHPQWMPWAK